VVLEHDLVTAATVRLVERVQEEVLK